MSGEDNNTCHACEQFFDTADTCGGNYVPLTRDEEAVLACMRELKAKVAEVKRRLLELEQAGAPQAAAAAAARKELETLRCRWQELERQREQARELRMKILGHSD